MEKLKNLDLSFVWDPNHNEMIYMTPIMKLFPNKNLATIARSKMLIEYVNGLVAKYGGKYDDYIYISHNRIGQGTYVHRKVFLKIMQFFDVECQLFIEELIEKQLRKP